MVTNILKVKTSVPPLGRNIVQRPILLETLEDDLCVPEGFARPLTVVSAPAGFGKTTMVRAWLSGRESRTAWYSLDQGDNEADRFWVYVVSAVQAIEEGLGSGPLETLRSSSPFSQSSGSAEGVLTPLLNELFTLNSPMFLVLDDYHLISDPQIHQDMVFFVENLPPSVHLVVMTRSDPPWPLSRWRARGQMGELRLDRLKFNQEEARQLFEMSRGIRLNASQLATLHTKTEGWITGLQLAAFSLSTTHNADEFIDAFAGSHRHVLHFLSEEVLSGQPEDVQRFLVQTSTMERFCADLCDAITGRQDSAALLQNLEKKNLFVIPLDDQGVWYRYHQLFADLLRHRLQATDPDSIGALHDRAIQWFLDRDDPGEAVRQAMAGKRLELACQIMHDHYDRILRTKGQRLVYGNLARLPLELLAGYPRLAVHRALLHLTCKGTEQAQTCLELAEAQSYDDKSEQQEFLGLLAAVRCYYSICTNDFTAAIAYAEEALKALSRSNYYWRMWIAIFSGDTCLFSARPNEAYRFYLEGHRNSEKLDYRLSYVVTGFKVATSLFFLGRLENCEELVQKLLKTAGAEGLSRLPITGGLWVLLGELCRERGDLEEARRCIERGQFISATEPPILGWNSLFDVALSRSEGSLDSALQTIHRIEELNTEVRLPLFITSAAVTWKAQILLEMGKLAKARDVLAATGIHEREDMPAAQAREHLVLCRLLLHGEEWDKSLVDTMLDQIEKISSSGEETRLVLETKLAKALLSQKRGCLEEAEAHALSALQLGSEAGYYQVFVDEGKAIEDVYTRLLEKNQETGVIELATQVYQALTPPTKSVAKRRKQGSSHRLIEELSDRELEVLVLVSEGLSNQDIAQRLFVSIATIKWHTSNIYGKLGVKGRTKAVALARELQIIE